MITENPKYHFPKMHTSTVICSYLQVLSHLIGIVCQIYVKYIRTLPLIGSVEQNGTMLPTDQESQENLKFDKGNQRKQH